MCWRRTLHFPKSSPDETWSVVCTSTRSENWGSGRRREKEKKVTGTGKFVARSLYTYYYVLVLLAHRLSEKRSLPLSPARGLDYASPCVCCVSFTTTCCWTLSCGKLEPDDDRSSWVKSLTERLPLRPMNLQQSVSDFSTSLFVIYYYTGRKQLCSSPFKRPPP